MTHDARALRLLEGFSAALEDVYGDESLEVVASGPETMEALMVFIGTIFRGVDADIRQAIIKQFMIALADYLTVLFESTGGLASH